MQEISRFDGKSQFISNFYVSEFVYDGHKYTTVEHAFQAAKCVNDVDREKVRSTATPSKAKYWGKRIKLRPDWESVKMTVMENALRAKFENKELRELLDATKGQTLIEGNSWHDNQWGNCTCSKRKACEKPGKNMLGTLIMKVRDE